MYSKSERPSIMTESYVASPAGSVATSKCPSLWLSWYSGSQLRVEIQINQGSVLYNYSIIAFIDQYCLQKTDLIATL